MVILSTNRTAKAVPAYNPTVRRKYMHILVCDDDCRFAQDLTDRIQQQVRKSLKRVKVDCITDPAELPNLPLEHYDIAFLDNLQLR